MHRGSVVLVVLAVSAALSLALSHRDEIRARAELALGRGTPAREAELARGFVLGEDDRIDPATVEDFRRAGLSHLLAVSGQNVALLALLAMPMLAALGMPLRTRLLWVLAAIVAYVPLAGAGPSILRAGVMGGLGVLATLAGRRASRFYALALAAVVTLAIDPGIAADVGWQLSFAAVLGILAFAAHLRSALSSRLGAGFASAALAEGAAITVAATVSTAPLIAFHFEAISTLALLANLLVLPAVAPAMWLGMLAATAGQVPGLPLEPLNGVNALLLAYIAQVASWCADPSWAYPQVRLGGGGLIATYVALVLGWIGTPIALRRLRLARLRSGSPQATFGRNAFSLHSRKKALRPRRGLRTGITGGAIAVALAGLALWDGDGTSGVRGLRVSFFDIGQGDAILLQPAGAPAVLVDGGPPGADLADKLRAAGVARLAAAVVTHEQSDHAGGIEELLGRLPVARLAYSRLGRGLRRAAELAGAEPVRIAAGTVIRAGDLRLEALWPPSELLASPLGVADPNSQALVLLARWRHFSMLLSADAEAESVPIDPGPVDVLKVAHHGSEDTGLDALLERTGPRLAVISAGSSNPFGHPAPATLTTLASHGVPVLRTDHDGTIVLDVRADSVWLGTSE